MTAPLKYQPAIQASVEAGIPRLSEGPNARWLRDNSAAIRRAHADMLAERANSGTELSDEALPVGGAWVAFQKGAL